MKTRLYKSTDLMYVVQLFYDNIHSVCVNDYTLEQLDAWAPQNPDLYRWKASLSKNHTLVVEENGEIIGFGDMGETGYIDRLYVRKDYLHKGVATLILSQLEKYAKTKGFIFMTTAASITAKSFFEKKGFIVLNEQVVERRGARLKRYLMEKKL